jgi:hypothetical protein
MLFTVVPTHIQGQRRAKAAMADAERFSGHLLIQDWNVGADSILTTCAD